MAQQIRILLTAFALLCVGLSPAQAQTGDLRVLLQTPGVHAIMRHALAPGYSDPAHFDVNDCSTQRNLDDAGREQSRRIGAKLKALGAAFTEIRTSQWCRCKETAELLDLGTPIEEPVLNSFFEDRSTAKAQTDALRAHLSGLTDTDRVLYVTHQVNISALTGRGTGSGEMFFIRRSDSGKVEIVGTLEILP